MVSFRSGSSYDRWYEGRRTWASITATSRSFLRLLVSLGVGSAVECSVADYHLTQAFASPPFAAINPAQSRAMNDLAQTVVAFSWATMFRLRDLPGVDHPELRALLPSSLLEAYSDIPTLPGRRASVDGEGKVAHSLASESTRALEALNTEPSPRQTRQKHRIAKLPASATNLPLGLIRVMNAWLNEFHTAKLASAGAPDADTPIIDDATYSAGINSLNQFTDQLTALERIRDSECHPRRFRRRADPALIPTAPIPLILNM